MFFDECKTFAAVKTLYRRLSKCIHPDRGGDEDLMLRLSHEYEIQKERFNQKKPIDEIEVLGMISDILQTGIHKKEVRPILRIFEEFEATNYFTEKQAKKVKKFYEKIDINKK